MPPITILVAQTSGDILAESIAEGIRRRTDVTLSFDRVVPVSDLWAFMERTENCPDVVILIGLKGELDKHSNELLGKHPSLVVARIVIGSELVHMDLRQIDLQELIISACGLFRRHVVIPEQRLTEYVVVSDHSTAVSGGNRLGLLEIQRSHTMLDQALAWLDAMLRLHLERTAGPGNDLPGLSVSRATIERLLLNTSDEFGTELHDARLAVESANADLMHALEDAEPLTDPLADLCKGLELSTQDIKAFLLCLAPELDTKYQRVYGFINDDLGRRNASLGLITSVLGNALTTRIALANTDGFLRWRLVGTHGNSLPYGDDPLRVDPTLVAWLLGNRSAILRDSRLAEVVLPEPWVGADWLSDPADLRLAQTLKEILPLKSPKPRWVVLAGGDGSVWQAVLEKAADQLPISLLRISSAALDGPDREAIDERLIRLGWAARLMGLIPVVDALDVVSAPSATCALRRLIDAFNDLQQVCVLIVSDMAHAMEALPRDAFQLLQRKTTAISSPVALFGMATRAAGMQLTDADNEQVAAAHPLPLAKLDRAVRLAVAHGANAKQSTKEQASILAEACRVVACPELPRFATMLEPSFRLEQVVLPADRRQQIDDIVSHVLHASKVLNKWGFGAQLPYGKGVAALFSGPSGTGKTMAARAIGHALQRTVYSVDLSRVVSKYIGETEKNLDAVCVEAERSGAILCFDEADALFGKRSEVKDAHDRYANIETAYLLQRMEAFGGLAILTSNLGQNLDRAFLRRLRFVVDFPVPDANAREKIWRQCLPAEAPLAADMDFRFLSRRVEITGGNIRQITLRAAFAAAAEGIEGTPISMRHILQATRAEVLKLGMPGLERELAELAA